MIHLLKPKLITFPTLVLCILLGGLYSCDEDPKTIVYINSYHKGFAPSDQITRGVMENLPLDSIEFISFFMDTKRNPSEAFIKKKAEDLLDSIRELKPDVLIVSDDNALKHIVVPNFQNDPLPIVFCGVNWSVKQYDISKCNITGVLEILPIVELIQTLKPAYPEMNRVLVLNENTTTSRKTKPLLDTLLGNIGMHVSQELVDDFESWKSVFKEANDNYDIIYLQTKGAIQGWNHDEALKHIDQHIKIPLVTCEEFMMPYVVFGLTQLSIEQGRRAADKAKLILNGSKARDIPISRNTLTEVWINKELANRIDFIIEEVLMKEAKIVE
jgi:ABC-type uncharacterized transport system substrate-binding protein